MPSNGWLRPTSSTESAISSRLTSEARIPGVPWVRLSEIAIVLNSSGVPPAARTPAATRAASARWFRLHGIVPVQVVAIPTSGLLQSRSSSPIARRCARAPARRGLVTRSSFASRGTWPIARPNRIARHVMMSSWCRTRAPSWARARLGSPDGRAGLGRHHGRRGPPSRPGLGRRSTRSTVGQPVGAVCPRAAAATWSRFVTGSPCWARTASSTFIAELEADVADEPLQRREMRSGGTPVGRDDQDRRPAGRHAVPDRCRPFGHAGASPASGSRTGSAGAPTARSMYLIDSLAGGLDVFDFDRGSGAPSGRRRLVTFERGGGLRGRDDRRQRGVRLGGGVRRGRRPPLHAVR